MECIIISPLHRRQLRMVTNSTVNNDSKLINKRCEFHDSNHALQRNLILSTKI